MKSGIYKLGSTLLIILLLIVFSCKKDIKDLAPDQSTGTVKSMNDLKASSDFNWKTTQTVELDLTAGARSSLLVKSGSGVVFLKAMLNGKDAYKTAITIPNYMKELTFVINGNPMVIKIENNRITHAF